MNHTVVPFGAYTGRMIVGTGTPELSGLDPAEVIALLAESGYLVIRGFASGIDTFNAFIKSISSVVVADPARQFHGDAAQKVDAGMQAVGLHLENGNSPFRPDLTWFLCEKAASSGSQTTVCDGYQVWAELPESSRQAWTAQEIVYARTVHEQAWRRLAMHLMGGTKPYDEVTLDDLRAFLREPERTEVRDNGDGSVHYAHREPAVRVPTLFGSAPAWANSIFSPSVHYEQPVITFADGTPFPADLLEEAAKITDAVTEEVDWRDGDVVVIDNSRVMHGRREILDPVRLIFNAQSYIKPELVNPAGKLADPAGKPINPAGELADPADKLVDPAGK